MNEMRRAVHVRDSLDIDVGAVEVFDLTQDYARRPLWDGLTPQAWLLGDGPAGVGRVARCPIGWGMVLDVSFVSYQRPRVAAFTLQRGPWLFESLAGSWRFEPLDDAHTRVTFTYHLRLHAALAWILTPLVRRQVERHTRQRLHGLKRLAEKGREEHGEVAIAAAGSTGKDKTAVFFEC